MEEMTTVHGTVTRSLGTFASHRLVLSALFACAAVAAPARAQDQRQAETIAEANAYFGLSDRFRLFTTANVTKSLSEGVADSEIGAYLDILALKTIPGLLLDIDVARARYLWGRVGFSFGGKHEGTDLEQGYSERQFVFEISGRYPIPLGFTLLTRARFDMRTLSGGHANRFRLRIGMEKEYTVLGTELIPYARAEFLHDSRFGAWNSQIYQVGVDIALSERFRIEPYYAFVVDTAVQPAHVDRLGLVLKYYR